MYVSELFSSHVAIHVITPIRFSLDYLIYRDEWIKFDTIERLLIKFFLLSIEKIVQIDCAVN